jgi:hypothetical protein
MRAVVYTGTSINHNDARKILEAEYHPPIRRDDIRKLMKSPPGIIGIIDGVFFDSAAVAHREIIEALRGGVIVIGGGSMGALRASELGPYGMIGVGRVYEMYRSGAVESDDEVAVTFNDETMEALSLPLVNVRLTVKAMQEAGVLTGEQASAIVDVTRKLFYPDRNYRNIIGECIKKGVIGDKGRDKLLGDFRKYEVDVKREDAVLVLEKIKEIMQSPALE